MEIIISNNAGKPIYEQITSQMKAMIMSGELQAGDSIPSMRALAKSIHVSVITVQKAYEDLGIPSGSLPISEEISATELSLPMYYGMKAEADYVIEQLNNWKA